MTHRTEISSRNTPANELIEALDGRRRVTVLLVDEIPAFELQLDASESGSLTSEHWSSIRAAKGKVTFLPRGEYELPSMRGAQQSAVVLRLCSMAGINEPKGLGLLFVVVEKNGILYKLARELPGGTHGDTKFGSALGLPDSSTLIVHDPKLNASPSGPTPTADQKTKPTLPAKTSPGHEWKAKARARAIEIIERQRQCDLYPSQENLADEIAKEFRNAGVVGAGDKPLTGASIKRHALKGISSGQGKQLSTSTRRGK